MARKVFISFLGSSNYGACHYYCHDGYESESVRYVQEATLKYLLQKDVWKEDDVAYIMLTQVAEYKNWKDNWQQDRDGNVIVQAGLQTRLQEAHFPFAIKTIEQLPEGNTEDEIWEIFNRIYEVLEEGDELYFDITHGFRYLPMLVLVLCNYAKFLKNVLLKFISYGNFEGRNKVTNEALLVNLLPIAALQDWTDASASYLQSGNIGKIVELAQTELRPILRKAKGTDKTASSLKDYIVVMQKIIEQHVSCRGRDLIKAETIKRMRDKSADALEREIIPPLQPVLQKLNASFCDYHADENVENGFLAVRWCLNNNLYQQAITLLQETMVTYFCTIVNYNWETREDREIVSEAFSVWADGVSEDSWRGTDEKKNTMRKFLNKITNETSDDVLQKMKAWYRECRDVRNDYNHGGMLDNRQSTSKLKCNIIRLEEEFRTIKECWDSNI